MFSISRIIGALMLLALAACQHAETPVSQSPEQELPAFSTTIEVVVERGTNALAFVPNANRSNFDDGRPAIAIALLEEGETFPLDPNFVIQRIELEVPAGTRQGVLCTGTSSGEGYHESFNVQRLADWRAGKPKKGLAAVISTEDRNRLGPLVAPIEAARGYPKDLG